MTQMNLSHLNEIINWSMQGFFATNLFSLSFHHHEKNIVYLIRCKMLKTIEIINFDGIGTYS